jgi:hypothetical protein
VRVAIRRAGIALALLVSVGTGPAAASSTQVAIFQDDNAVLNNPVGTLDQIRSLGAGVLRLSVRWNTIAPAPGSRRRPRFDAANPAAYPAANWRVYDQIVGDSFKEGIRVNFDVAGGAPVWATGPGAPPNEIHPVWEPAAKEYGRFVRALGTRYSGDYNPKTRRLDPGNPVDLPRVDLWSVWNEPNYGPSLAPQGLPGALSIEHSPQMYRGLVDAAWSALHATGHGGDTFLFGEVAPRGRFRWGVFAGMKPLIFVRALYCVGADYRPLSGLAAALRGCPATPAGAAAFAVRHPALFRAGGFSVHPYSRWYPPDVENPSDPDYSSLADIGQLTRGLDRITALYGSPTHFPIWNTEYGYITSPPKRVPDHGADYVSPAVAAGYLNWAEYISYRTPRIASFEQFLLTDPLPALRSNDYGGFASGLQTHAGSAKPTYAAWRLPIYLPVTATSAGHSLEVWGAARPAHFALFDDPLAPESVEIQFAPGSSHDFTTISSLDVNDPGGYFDTRLGFPASGSVRLAYTVPDGVLGPDHGTALHSRIVRIKVD